MREIEQNWKVVTNVGYALIECFMFFDKETNMIRYDYKNLSGHAFDPYELDEKVKMITESYYSNNIDILYENPFPSIF